MLIDFNIVWEDIYDSPKLKNVDGNSDFQLLIEKGGITKLSKNFSYTFFCGNTELMITKKNNNEILLQDAVISYNKKWSFNDLSHALEHGIALLHANDVWFDAAKDNKELIQFHNSFKNLKYINDKEIIDIMINCGIDKSIKQISNLLLSTFSKEQLFEIARYYTLIDEAYQQNKITKEDINSFIDKSEEFIFEPFQSKIGRFRYASSAREAAKLFLKKI